MVRDGGRNIFHVVYTRAETRARQISPGVVGWMMARHPCARRPLGGGPADTLGPADGVRSSDRGRTRTLGRDAGRDDCADIGTGLDPPLPPSLSQRTSSGLGEGERLGRDIYFVPRFFRPTVATDNVPGGEKIPGGTKFGFGRWWGSFFTKGKKDPRQTESGRLPAIGTGEHGSDIGTGKEISRWVRTLCFNR